MNKLMRDKTLNPIQKLMMILFLDWNSLIPISMTSQEIATELGLTRTQVLKNIECLVEMGFITTQVSHRNRKIYITKLFKEKYNV